MEDLNKSQNQEEKNQTSSDSTQQTNNQESQVTEKEPIGDPPIEDNREYIANLEARIAEQQISNRRLETLLTKLNENKQSEAPPAPRNVEAERTKFYQDPTGILEEREQRLLKQMERMLEPLKEVATSFKTTSEYDRIKAIVKRDPVFGKGLQDPEVEATVDAIMKSSGVEVTEDNVKSAIAQAFGMKAMGGFGTRRTENNNNSTPSNNNRLDPPQVPTSRTRVNAPEPRKELTEDDKLAMRYAGLKPGNPDDEKEYWSLIGDATMTLDVHKKGS